MKKLLLLLIIMPLLFSCNESSKVDALEEKLDNSKLQHTIEVYETDTINSNFEKILIEEYGLAKEDEIIFKLEN